MSESIKRPVLSERARDIASRDFNERTEEEFEFLRAEHEAKRLCVRCHTYPASWMMYPDEFEPYPVSMCVLCMTPYEHSLYHPKYSVRVTITEDELLQALRQASDLFQDLGDGNFKALKAN